MVSQTNFRPFEIDGLRYGLNSKDRPEDLPKGAAQRELNGWHYRSLRQQPGFSRVISKRPWLPCMMLDGVRQHFYARVPSAGTPLGLNHASMVASGIFSIDGFFTIKGLAQYQYLLHKVIDGDSDYGGPIVGTNTQYALYLFWNAPVGGFGLNWQQKKAAAGYNTVQYTATALLPDQAYYFRVSGSTISGNITLAIYTTDVETGTVTLVGTASSGGHGADAIPPDPGTQKSFAIGGKLCSPTAITGLGARDGDRVRWPFRGKIQEIRYWSGDISAAPSTYGSTEISHITPGLETVYHLSDVGPTIFADAKGASPSLYIHPVDATWNATTLVGASGSSIFLDGHLNYLRVPEPVLYRKRDVDADGKYQILDEWSWAVAVRVPELRQMTVAHSIHTSSIETLHEAGTAVAADPRAPWSGATGATPFGQAQWELQVAQNPGGANDWQIRAIFWWYDTGTSAWRFYSLVSALGGAGLAVNTTYMVMFGRNNTTGRMDLYVNGANTNATAGATFSPLATDNNPLNSSRQYAIVIGRAIQRSVKANNNPNDPDDIELKYRLENGGDLLPLTAPFRGNVGQLAALSIAPSEFLARYLQSNRLTSETANTLQSQLISAWPFDAGAGSSLRDIGGEQNSIPFRDDADHLRGRSQIQTLSRGRVTAMVQHSWRGDASDEEKLLAVHAGGCDEVDVTNNKLLPFVEGFRNDENRRVSIVTRQDTLVLCSGSGPLMQLSKDQLVRLGIEAPVGPFAWGFTEQNQRDAALNEGDYTYYLTYWNSDLDKESPPSKPIKLSVRFKKTNVSFGKGIEAFQTYPQIAQTAAHGWSKQSIAEPWDLTGNNQWLRIAAWVQPKENAPGGAAPAAKYKKARFTSAAGNADPLIRNVDDVKVDEVRAIIEEDCPRITLVTAPDGSFTLEGCFAGANGKIRLNNDAQTTITAAIFGLTINTTYSGTGVTSDLGLPLPGDGQVTHLRIYRTLANDGDARLVLQVALNSEDKITDRLPDLLNIDQVLDLDVQGPPRDFRQIVGQFGRLLLLDHKTAPARMAWSEQGFPWQFLPSDEIDFTDGRIGTRLRITGAAATEGMLLVTRSDFSLVLTEPRSSQAPFIVDPKSQDTGASSFFGFVNVNGVLLYPAARGFHRFDGSSPEYISQVIQPTWRATRNRDLIHGEHWRDQETALWSVASGGSFDTDGVTPINDGLFSLAYNAGQDQFGRRVGWGVSTGLYLRGLYLIPNASDVEELWAIDPFGFIYKFDEGVYSYGLPSHTVTLTASGTFGVPQAAQQVGLPINGDATNLPEKYLGFAITVQQTSTGLRETRLIIACATGGGFDVCGLDHPLAFIPAAGDTWELCTIEFDWLSGKMAIAGEAFTSQSFDLHVDQTVPGTPATNDLLWRWSGGLTVNPGFKTRVGGVTNQKGDDIFALEGRGRRLEIEWRARGVNKPIELGSMTVLPKPQQAAKRPAP